MERIEYTIKVWKNDTTNYRFDNLEEARVKARELTRLLRSNEKITVTKEVIKSEELSPNEFIN